MSGFLLLVIIAVSISILVMRYSRHVIMNILLTGLISMIVWHVAGYVVEGDEVLMFWPITVITTWIWASIIGAAAIWVQMKMAGGK